MHLPNIAGSRLPKASRLMRGVGAVLSQMDADGRDHPVVYYSRKFLLREQRYSTVEK